MDSIARNLSSPILGPLYAFLAGILASASPCALGAMPLLLGHLAGVRSKNRKPLILFILGMAVSLTAAGVLAGVLGRSISLTMPWTRWVAGLSFIVAGLFSVGILGPRQCRVGTPVGVEGGPGAIGSMIMGILYGLSTSPCGTPALLAILTLAAMAGGVLKGAVLLLAYSLGQSVLLVAAALAASRLRRFLEIEKNLVALDWARIAGGILTMGFGAYVLVAPYL